MRLPFSMISTAGCRKSSEARASARSIPSCRWVQSSMTRSRNCASAWSLPGMLPVRFGASPMKNGEVIADFYSAFYPALREQQCTTRALCYADVAQGIGSASFEGVHTLIVAGFYALNRAEQIDLPLSPDLDQSILLFQDGPGLDQQLEAMGLSGKNPSQERLRGRSGSLCSAPRTHTARSSPSIPV